MALAGTSSPQGVVGVAVDVLGLDRVFYYRQPGALVGPIALGSIVRVPLSGRRVRGWVVELDAEPPSSIALRELIEVVSLGPSEELVELARFATWRYAGWWRPFLSAASPSTIVSRLPGAGSGRTLARRAGALVAKNAEVARLTKEALEKGLALLRMAPRVARLDVVLQALAGLEDDAGVLVLVPEHSEAQVLQRRLERLGVEAVLWPEQWAEAAAGGRVVIGTRSAVWASVAELSLVIVLDAHAEAYREQRVPTWNATVLAKERARARGAACLFVSPCPTLELLAEAGELALAPAVERAGWPLVQVLDRRGDDPRSGLYSPELAGLIRAALTAEPSRPVLCVLNRTGRARLLACSACGELLTCEQCGKALRQSEAAGAGLFCPSCGAGRASFCTACGSTSLKTLRIGVARAAEELGALTGAMVQEVSAKTREAPGRQGILVGTDAVLHRASSASVVVFLDFDQELLAPRFRANEEALSMLARAARLLGGREGPSRGRSSRRLLIQTRQPGHEVLQAVQRGEPSLWRESERRRRKQLSLPPFSALAQVSGQGAALLVQALANALGGAIGAAPLEDGTFLLRARTTEELCEALAQASTHQFGVRIELDPRRV